MATNVKQPGNVITWTNATGSDVASGDLVKLSHMLGVAAVDIANGASGSVHVEGVFDNIPKVTAATFAQGEKLIWDVSVGKFDDAAATPASGDVTGGAIAWVAGANLETTCTIKLTPGNATLTA